MCYGGDCFGPVYIISNVPFILYLVLQNNLEVIMSETVLKPVGFTVADPGAVRLFSVVIIWKQWKVPKKRQWGLQKLGIRKDLARLTAYCGDRYYWVVTKTCVSRAISKGVLEKAGLVSCLDYYNKRHALKLC